MLPMTNLKFVGQRSMYAAICRGGHRKEINWGRSGCEVQHEERNGTVW